MEESQEPQNSEVIISFDFWVARLEGARWRAHFGGAVGAWSELANVRRWGEWWNVTSRSAWDGAYGGYLSYGELQGVIFCDYFLRLYVVCLPSFLCSDGGLVFVERL